MKISQSAKKKISGNVIINSIFKNVKSKTNRASACKLKIDKVSI